MSTANTTPLAEIDQQTAERLMKLPIVRNALADEQRQRWLAEEAEHRARVAAQYQSQIDALLREGYIRTDRGAMLTASGITVRPLPYGGYEMFTPAAGVPLLRRRIEYHTLRRAAFLGDCRRISDTFFPERGAVVDDYRTLASYRLLQDETPARGYLLAPAQGIAALELLKDLAEREHAEVLRLTDELNALPEEVERVKREADQRLAAAFSAQQESERQARVRAVTI